MIAPPPLSFVWHTFRDDAACLMQSIAAVRVIAPEASLHVFVDPSALLPASVLESLIEDEVAVHGSSAAHGANLNGLEHLDQQLRHLAFVARPGGWVVKIDSDTFVQSLDWLAAAVARDASAAGFAVRGCPLAGPCYALRADVPGRLASILDTNPALVASLAPKYPEDMTTALLLQAMALRDGDKIAIVPGWPASRVFAGFNYAGEARHIVPSPYLFMEVVTFGNRASLDGSDAERRATAAEAMRQLRERAAPASV